MTRWGKPTKNKRRTNPKYRLDELGANPPPLEGNENDRAMSLAGEFLQMAKAELDHSQGMGGEGNPALIPVIDRLVDMRRGHVLLPEDLLAFIDSPEVEESGLQADFRAKAGIFAKAQLPGIRESKQPTTKTLMEGFKSFLNEEERFGTYRTRKDSTGRTWRHLEDLGFGKERWRWEGGDNKEYTISGMDVQADINRIAEDEYPSEETRKLRAMEAEKEAEEKAARDARLAAEEEARNKKQRAEADARAAAYKQLVLDGGQMTDFDDEPAGAVDVVHQITHPKYGLNAFKNDKEAQIKALKAQMPNYPASKDRFVAALKKLGAGGMMSKLGLGE